MIACFVILGMAEGLWVVHIPLVQARLHLSDGSLGAVLLVGPGAVVLMMPVAGWLADRFGSARVARPIGLVVTFLSVILDWARTLSFLGATELDPDTLGAVVKDRDDLELAREIIAGG